MRAGERGFLLLTSQLGDPERKVLSVAQFRMLAKRVQQMDAPRDSRDLRENDLICLGYDRKNALKIVQMLNQDRLLDKYLLQGKKQDCMPLCRISERYPAAVRHRLGLDAPGCLWTKGDLSLLDTDKIALVGSRNLQQSNRAFAESAGREAARQGITLVSGNARGADQTAQDACLEAGGSVIAVVADELQKYPIRKNVLYMSEDGFDLPFSAQRALSRNRVIHAMGSMTLVAQCSMQAGGTWNGTCRNLQKRWSPVFCFDDKSDSASELEQMGAILICAEDLQDFALLQTQAQPSLL